MGRMSSNYKRLTAVLMSAILMIFAAIPAFGQSLIRDTEIEETLRAYTDPILRAANLQSSSVDLFLVNDPSLNAFVTRGQNIFVHTGLILEAETPNQLKGVLAHEAAHIASGHLARRDQSNRSAYGSMLIAAGLGLAAILAGEGQAGAAILAGSTQFGTLDVLAHSRINEASADQAAANYLEITGQSGLGLVQFFEKFRYQEVLSNARRYPYFRGHPLSSDRIDKLREVTSESQFANVEDTDEEAFALIMAKAKLIGFIDAPQTVFSKYPETDSSKPGRYARAVAYYRAADLKNAVKTIDSLIEEEPENPYFHELKGQILYESGKGADAIEPMTEAVRLKPEAALLEIALAQALIEGGTSPQIDQSIDLLKSALRKENTNGFAWYLLSQSYDRKGEPALARYAIAEQSFAMGNYQRARSFAQRAQEGLREHKAQSRRASDIIVISGAQLASNKNRRR
ncbi:MAG: M48 family peptidase [Acidimicrobiales bacterium]|nr:M48 family metallopeptidase [Hyphomonadaceae bacterium]RZV35922.1 MAG: M48 family peptidase [Acidimicrobiales bacterium]